MKPASNQKRKGRPSQGYTEAAAALGVTTSHLWKVAKGDRISARLTNKLQARYPQLLKSGAQRKKLATA